MSISITSSSASAYAESIAAGSVSLAFSKCTEPSR